MMPRAGKVEDWSGLPGRMQNPAFPASVVTEPTEFSLLEFVEILKSNPAPWEKFPNNESRSNFFGKLLPGFPDKISDIPSTLRKI